MSRSVWITKIFGLFALLALLVLSGCVGRSGGDTASATSPFPFEAPEETVTAPSLPDDDGVPLSPQERAAMDSTGELDANLRPEEKRLVELHFKFFVHKNRGTFERFLKRSEPYLPYVRHVFKSRGVPEEIAYLAYVESGFNPNAVSPVGAAGMWQFMPYTGKKYGLTQDRWIDERRDAFKATHAAIDYLQKLHGDFGDWLLAVAAYNAGEGKIGRAIAGTEAKTFFDICRNNHKLDAKAQLKDETQQYVPRFLAVAKIMRNLDALGFVRPNSANAYSVANVSVPGGVDLRSLARNTGLTWEQFTSLNPAYKRPISPPTMQTAAYVPFDKATQATAWLDKKESRVFAGWRDYTVRRGETLASISKRQGVSPSLLRLANNLPNDRLKPGTTLAVPGSAKIALATASAMPAEGQRDTRDVPPRTVYKGIHQVQEGDTLYALANRWNTTVDEVRHFNKLTPTTPLQIGQTIYIPGKGGTTAVAETSGARDSRATSTGSKYSVVKGANASPAPVKQARNAATSVTVKSGDTLYSIARANSMGVDELRTLNNLGPKSTVRVGQRLSLVPQGKSVRQDFRTATTQAGAGSKKPQEQARQAKQGTKGHFAVVQPGDTLSSLARSNNTTVAVLSKLNGLNGKTTLRQGQLVKLP